jgi:transcriptional regulator with XRE-family HTH domain
VKLPTGRQIKAARILIGIEQRELAKQAGINASTLSRMESSGGKSVRGQGRTIQAVVDALQHNGVEIVEDGLRLKPKKKAR